LGCVLIEASPNVCFRLVLATLLPILLALALGHRSDWNEQGNYCDHQVLNGFGSPRPDFAVIV
jgi:hypothetical protein